MVSLLKTGLPQNDNWTKPPAAVDPDSRPSVLSNHLGKKRFSRFPSGRDLAIPTRKENRDDTTTSTDDGGYANEWSFRKHADTVCRCGGSAGPTLSSKSGTTCRTGFASVLSLSR